MDPSQIDQILVNLCVNARDAISECGKIIIKTGNTYLDEKYCVEHVGFIAGEYTQLTVSDNGTGMDRKTLSQIFDPFFTTKKAGEGAGLGLATVYGIVKQNNGFVNVYSELDHRTTFKIYLPPLKGDIGQSQVESPAKQEIRGDETVLVVEDESSLLELCKQKLQELGYYVLDAATPSKAIELAETHTGDIHLLLTDVIMPEMNGQDLSKQLLTLYPDMKCLFMSGYTANVIVHHNVLDEGVHLLQKPFTIQSLAIKVREVIDG